MEYLRLFGRRYFVTRALSVERAWNVANPLAKQKIMDALRTLQCV